MADIHLSSGKREQEIRETFRHPLVLGCIAIFFVVLSMTFSHPLSDFIHEHHQFFYVSLTIGTIPFGIFIFVLYSQYEQRQLMKRYNNSVNMRKKSS
mmetsp:Transcript_59807/g.103027  ORF Transcript_59807/g.103027 Transcript_59807/m.103027 type:complete len:97 (-) Transcript_59807:139-429(-)